MRFKHTGFRWGPRKENQWYSPELIMYSKQTDIRLEQHSPRCIPSRIACETRVTLEADPSWIQRLTLQNIHKYLWRIVSPRPTGSQDIGLNLQQATDRLFFQSTLIVEYFCSFIAASLIVKRLWMAAINDPWEKMIYFVDSLLDKMEVRPRSEPIHHMQLILNLGNVSPTIF